jgi:hypothetical protein
MLEDVEELSKILFSILKSTRIKKDSINPNESSNQ